MNLTREKKEELRIITEQALKTMEQNHFKVRFYDVRTIERNEKKGKEYTVPKMTVAIATDGQVHVRSVAVCHFNDNYCRLAGKAQSARRLVRALKTPQIGSIDLHLMDRLSDTLLGAKHPTSKKDIIQSWEGLKDLHSFIFSIDPEDWDVMAKHYVSDGWGAVILASCVDRMLPEESLLFEKRITVFVACSNPECSFNRVLLNKFRGPVSQMNSLIENWNKGEIATDCCKNCGKPGMISTADDFWDTIKAARVNAEKGQIAHPSLSPRTDFTEQTALSSAAHPRTEDPEDPCAESVTVRKSSDGLL